MINLSLNELRSSLPTAIKATLWQFIRGDIAVRDFELWVYSNDDDHLRQTLSEDSYLALAMVDYKDSTEITALKTTIYNFLVQFSESCLCNTFPDNTLLYTFGEENESVVLEKQISLLEPIMSIENFSGEPSHYDRWYYSGKLCCCAECKTWWFVIFEEREAASYYLVRLKEDEALYISQFPRWPNENWPSNLKNWDAFLHLNFQYWNTLYIRKHTTIDSTNFLKNYHLNPSKYG